MFLNELPYWTDAKGKKIFIVPFFSKLYVDSEMQRLSRLYQIWSCDGNQRGGLGKAEPEILAGKVLGLVRLGNLNPPSLVGVKKSELIDVVKRYHDDEKYVKELVSNGCMREETIMDDVVVFPTEALLEALKIPKRM